MFPQRPQACQQVYNKIAPWIISGVLCAIVFERMDSYAQAVDDKKTADKTEEEEELTVIGNLNQKKFDHIKTKQDACKAFEGKIVTYYDKTSFVQNCKQLEIGNPDILNELTQRHGRTLVEIPARVYRMIPFGEEFTTGDLMNLKKTKSATYKNCSQLNNQYVTANAERYYLIENCVKRPFNTYFDLENHNTSKKTIVSVPEDELDAIPTGKQIAKNENEFDILYKIDGDPNWNKMTRFSEGKIQADSPESLEKVDRDSRNVNLNELCKRVNRHFVSFYSVIYFIDGCTAHVVKELSIKYQRQIDESGGIMDLTAEQLKAIPKGKEISVKAAIDLIGKKPR